MTPKLLTTIHMRAPLFCLAVFILSACGGGGGATTATVTPPPPVVVAPPPTLSGTVAVGAPMLNATVTVKDANGLTVTDTVAADGSFSAIKLTGMLAPFSIQACGMVDANYVCIYSVASAAGVANVTPLTNASVALALGSDPAGMFAATAAKPAPTSAELDTQKARLKTALAGLLAKIGISNVDFTSTAFNADRTGMDKLLDSLKIRTGTDGGSNKTFVQMEGLIGSGNVFLDKDASQGSITAGAANDVDLKGISSIFVQGLSFAISASDRATCVSRLNAADIFDDSFSLKFEDHLMLNKSNAAAMICQFAQSAAILGGHVANPVLRECDFSSDPNKKMCVVGFNMINGDVSFDGAELAIVLRSGGTWKLLGRQSAYDIHIGSAVQRTSRVDIVAEPSYMRALTFDIGGDDGVSATGVRLAKVFQRNLDGSGWEATPLLTLTLSDACIAQLGAEQKARLSIGGSCGSSWLSLGDTGEGANAAAKGDQLIDNFYKRGRTVKLQLFNNLAASGTPVEIIKRVDGVPPKFAALASFPWLELDAASKTTLLNYDGAAASLSMSWIANRTVSAKDISLCLAGGCVGSERGGHAEIINGRNSQVINVQNKPGSATAFKVIGLYGRNSEQLGISSNYVSCGGVANCYNH